jgi:uncharacterized protein
MSLLIETGRLRQKPEKISGVEPVSVLEMEFGELVSPKGPLKYDLTVQLVSGELLVRGTLALEVDCRCARCGGNFSRKIAISDFCRDFNLTSKNALINLTSDVREDILLSLPMVALCSEKCRGLCSGCGVNLNRENCRCQRQDGKNVWKALDGLRLQ